MIVKLQERNKCDWVNMVSKKIKIVLDDSLKGLKLQDWDVGMIVSITMD